MNRIGPAGAMGITMLLVGLTSFLFPEGALAADPAWRPTYDLAMRWINFLLLVGVIVKYAREPIKDFLKQRKQDIVSEIESLDAEKKRVLEEIEAAKKKGDENRIRLYELRERLVAQGKARKEQIISQAKQQSAIMLEEARRKMQNQIIKAKSDLKTELLDLAMDRAVQQLPEQITDQDNQQMVDRFMQSI